MPWAMLPNHEGLVVPDPAQPPGETVLSVVIRAARLPRRPSESKASK
jgi:hypothetical protein